MKTCHTLVVKTLVMIRHAKAEQSGRSDFERQLTDRGTLDATEAGQWLAARGVEPDQALVSAAVRAQQTWEAVNEGGGWDLEGTADDALYEAGTETALDLIRETEDVIRTLVVVGHNPTVASLATLLDDG
ncbi:MAG: phosphohistidine phosphatase, partial [Nocardioidaceae bacterium]|nr:phosphohistidine phosphatase [Nocardioidaceae bacterium]